MFIKKKSYVEYLFKQASIQLRKREFYRSRPLPPPPFLFSSTLLPGTGCMLFVPCSVFGSSAVFRNSCAPVFCLPCGSKQQNRVWIIPILSVRAPHVISWILLRTMPRAKFCTRTYPFFVCDTLFIRLAPPPLLPPPLHRTPEPLQCPPITYLCPSYCSHPRAAPPGTHDVNAYQAHFGSGAGINSWCENSHIPYRERYTYKCISKSKYYFNFGDTFI